MGTMWNVPDDREPCRPWIGAWLVAHSAAQRVREGLLQVSLGSRPVDGGSPSSKLEVGKVSGESGEQCQPDSRLRVKRGHLLKGSGKEGPAGSVAQRGQCSPRAGGLQGT